MINSCAYFLIYSTPTDQPVVLLPFSSPLNLILNLKTNLKHKNKKQLNYIIIETKGKQQSHHLFPLLWNQSSRSNGWGQRQTAMFPPSFSTFYYSLRSNTSARSTLSVTDGNVPSAASKNSDLWTTQCHAGTQKIESFKKSLRNTTTLHLHLKHHTESRPKNLLQGKFLNSHWPESHIRSLG